MDPLTTISGDVLSAAAYDVLKHTVSYDSYEDSVDEELREAFDRALKKSGVKGERGREHYLDKADKALEELKDPSDERLIGRFSFTKKLLENFRYEIIQNPSLSRYLQQKYVEDNRDRLKRIEDQLGRLLRLGRLHRLLPWLEDRERQNRHPNRSDFEGESYYRNAALHEAVWEKLNRGKRALILGAPASGKTALALGIAYEFMRNEPENTAYYVSVRRSSASGWIKEIKQQDHTDALFIVDDAHAAIDETNRFASGLHKIDGGVLVVSRSIADELTGPIEESYFESLKSHKVPVQVDETTLREIILRLAHREEVGADKIGDVETLLEKCEGDLHLLNYYVRAWRESETEYSCISDVDEREVLEYVHNRYLAKSDNRELLQKVAALSQFEIPVLDRWVDGPEEREAIQSEALVDRFSSEEWVDWEIQRPFWFLEYFHATPAAYLLKAAAYRRDLDSGKRVDEYTFDMLEEYLQSKPINFLDVFYNLHQNDRADLQDDLFEKTDVFAWFNEWLHETDDATLAGASVLTGLWPFLLGVAKWDEATAEELFRDAQEAIDKEVWRDYLQQAPLPKVNLTFALQRFDEDYVLDLLSSLDFSELGKHAGRRANSAVVKIFIDNTLRAGIKADRIQAFFKQFNFGVLGEEVREHGVGFASVTNLIQRVQGIGVEPDPAEEFCKRLNFGALGEQAKEKKVGLATVTNFVHYVQQAGVEADRVQAFCEGFDFGALGDQVKRDQVFLGTIKSFILELQQSGIEADYVQTLCKGLDFEALGQSALNVSKFRNILSILNLLLRSEAITPSMARDFIEGFGWNNLSQGMTTYFQPDVLAVLRILLTKKCNFTPSELRDKGLCWKPKSVWLHAFTSNPCSKEYEGLGWRSDYLSYALKELLREDIETLLQSSQMSLRNWNILIHNLSLTYLEKTRDLVASTRDFVSSILSNYSSESLKTLFAAADLRNISIFLTHFNSNDPTFDWTLPEDIDFGRIDLSQELSKCSLEELSHFLFNFHFIGRRDWSHHFGEKLQGHSDQLEVLIEEADLTTVDFFFWNWWMAFPEGEVPEPVQNGTLIEIIADKSAQGKKDRKGHLGLIGTLHLSGGALPESLKGRLDEQFAKERSLESVRDGRLKSIRLLAGLLAVAEEPLSEDETHECHHSLRDMTFEFYVPNQEHAIQRLGGWLT